VIVHAGLLALRHRGLWTGALVEGPSGAGKSDLALRAMAAGLRLVADDRVVIWPCDGHVYGRAPDTLSGLVEVRGLDVMRACTAPLARVAVRVRCVEPGGNRSRLYDGEVAELAGIPLPVVELCPFEPSAVWKLHCSICHIGQLRQGAYQAPVEPHSLP
jgi:serine kinase of HPr protein (carbohydrate metabolism regulator)